MPVAAQNWINRVDIAVVMHGTCPLMVHPYTPNYTQFREQAVWLETTKLTRAK
jgi:hypothetical protein